MLNLGTISVVVTYYNNTLLENRTFIRLTQIYYNEVDMNEMTENRKFQ